MPRLLASLAFAFFASLAPAQTFVVDQAGGAGTHYTSLATALGAVPDGATLLVRNGLYSTNTVVTGRGVTIVADGFNARVTGHLTFSGLGANQRVVIQGLVLSYVGDAHLDFQSCQGAVHLEDCNPTPLGSTGTSLTVDACAQVSVVRCSFSKGGTFSASNVTCITASFFNGSIPPLPALTITGGRTRLVRGQVEGYSLLGTSSPAISLDNADLAVVGGAYLKGGGNGAGGAITGTGTVALTSGVLLVGSSIPFTTIDHGWTTSTAAPLGGTVTGKLEGSASLFGLLVFGLPQAAAVVTDFTEELWVEPLGFVASGMLDVPRTFSLDVPNDAILRGMVFGWQGVTFGPAGGVLTNPAWFCSK